ncbi:MAG: PEP-utilizing enzyme [Acidimicrobiales bacterium]
MTTAPTTTDGPVSSDVGFPDVGFPDVGFPDVTVDGFWAQDRIHAPRPISPLAVQFITDTMAIGFNRAHQEYGAPLVMHTRAIGHYLFSAMRPLRDPAELQVRAERYQHLDTILDEVGPRWEQQWKPALIERVLQDRRADYRQLTNAELIEELERQRLHMIDQWTIHGRINFSVVAAARFADFYTERFEPEDSTEAYQLLQGFVTRSVDTSHQLWTLSRMVRAEPLLQRLFAERDNAEVLAALRADDASVVFGRFLHAFEAYLDEFGWRSDAVYDVADVTWREDPTIPLDGLRGYIGVDDDHDPARSFHAAVARRAALLAAARDHLAEDPDTLATFERYYEAASYNLPLTEDHAFWIDQSGVVNVRRFLLQVGEALVADGCLAEPSDVFFLLREEVALALAHGGDWRSASVARRRSVQAAAQADPPRVLGTPPPPAPGPVDPLFEAIAVRLAGRRPPAEGRPADPDILTGLAASPGIVTGTARVVRSLAEASTLNEGDIMVCEMTLPPWVPLFALAAAVVSDTGGVMSHCAIVAREFGLPAVVGTQVGTRTIRNGMTITVDGNRGVVLLG